MGTCIWKVLFFFWLGIVHSQAVRAELLHVSATADMDADEMQALLLLRDTLQVQDNVWSRNANPCYSWVGIACKGSRIFSVSLLGVSSLATNGLENGSVLLDSVVQALVKLSSLRSFNASGFLFQGTLPASISKLTQLNILDLTGVSLHGTIPAALGSLSNLEFLSLAENNLTGPISPAVDALENIRHFDLSYNGFTGPLPFTLFSKASQLLYVDLSHNIFEDRLPPYLGQLVHLQHLALGHNLLQGILPLNHLNWSYLEYLDVSNNNLWGSIADSISHLKSLTYLNLEHNYFTGSIPSSISNCSRLQALLLDHNVLTGSLPAPLALLTNLVILSSSFNSLSGTIPPGIFTLPHLTSLMLSHNLFSGALVFKESWPKKLQFFDISYNFLQGKVPRIPFAAENVGKNCFLGAPKQHSLKACRLFYSRNGIPWHGMPPKSVSPSGIGNSPKASRGSQAHKIRHLITILGCATGGAFLLATAGACVLCYERYCHELEVQVDGNMEEADSEGASSLDKHFQLINSSFVGEPFSYDTLHRATNGFSSLNMLANGQSGEFYKGTLDGGTDVVVKRVCTAKLIELYLKELEIFRRVFHRRLITVLGYCMDGPDEKFLVYKFMPFGNLASVLQTRDMCNEQVILHPRTPLDWITRLKIAVGVAEGLTYLHHGCSPHIIHGSIKASSVLLDEKFEVRLGSLSDARVEDKGSHPRLVSCLLGLSQSLDQVGQDSGNSVTTGRSKDVYDFGKLLLEILSGKCGITERRNFQTDSWVEWAVSTINVHDKEALYQLLDPSLIVGGDFLDEAMVMAVVAKACLNKKVAKRPKMRHALKALKNPTLLFQEEKAQSKLARILSQRSWNRAFRPVDASSSISASENCNEIVAMGGRKEKSTFLVQNPSYYINEIEELSHDDSEEV